jgi:hypothetical protein
MVYTRPHQHKFSRWYADTTTPGAEWRSCRCGHTEHTAPARYEVVPLGGYRQMAWGVRDQYGTVIAQFDKKPDARLFMNVKGI